MFAAQEAWRSTERMADEHSKCPLCRCRASGRPVDGLQSTFYFEDCTAA